MTALQERESAFESLFVHAEDVAFLTKVARDRRFGFWAASLMGLGSAATEEYARLLVNLGVSFADEDKLIERVADDFARYGIEVSRNEIRRALKRAAAVLGATADVAVTPATAR